MVDMLKQVTLAGKYKAEARLADLAAKEMAKHCDKRIAAMVKALEAVAAAKMPGEARQIALKALRALAAPSPS